MKSIFIQHVKNILIVNDMLKIFLVEPYPNKVYVPYPQHWCTRTVQGVLGNKCCRHYKNNQYLSMFFLFVLFYISLIHSIMYVQQAEAPFLCN